MPSAHGIATWPAPRRRTSGSCSSPDGSTSSKTKRSAPACFNSPTALRTASGVSEKTSGSASGVQVNLGNNTASGGDAEGDVLTNIENLTGSEKELGALQDAERDLAVAQTKIEAADIRRSEIVEAMHEAEEALLQFRDIDETREMLSGHRDLLSTQPRIAAAVPCLALCFGWIESRREPMRTASKSRCEGTVHVCSAD